MTNIFVSAGLFAKTPSGRPTSLLLLNDLNTWLQNQSANDLMQPTRVQSMDNL
jgi:hypothetical protein